MHALGVERTWKTASQATSRPELDEHPIIQPIQAQVCADSGSALESQCGCRNPKPYSFVNRHAVEQAEYYRCRHSIARSGVLHNLHLNGGTWPLSWEVA